MLQRRHEGGAPQPLGGLRPVTVALDPPLDPKTGEIRDLGFTLAELDPVPQGPAALAGGVMPADIELVRGQPMDVELVVHGIRGVASGARVSLELADLPQGVTAKVAQTALVLEELGEARVPHARTRATLTAATDAQVGEKLGRLIVKGSDLPADTSFFDVFVGVSAVGQVTPPGPPTNVTAVAGNASATVRWSTPASDGGSPITRYILAASPGGLQVEVGGSATEVVVRGLANGTAYTFTVTAVNRIGRGEPSTPSSPVTPRARSALTLVAEASGHAQESTAVRATLIDSTSQAGLEDKLVVFTLGAASVSATTGKDGVAQAAIALDQAPGNYTLRASFGGDPAFTGAEAGKPFVILKRPTSLQYTGATDGTRGATVALAARLTDSRRGSGLAGRAVTFTLGTLAGRATTDASGVASLPALLDQEPDSLSVAAGFAGDRFFEAAEAESPFELSWEAVFVDDGGQGVIFLNPSTQEFRFATEAEQTAIKRDPNMLLFPDATVLVVFADDEVLLFGGFELESGAFAAVVETTFGRFELSSEGAQPASRQRMQHRQQRREHAL